MASAPGVWCSVSSDGSRSACAAASIDESCFTADEGMSSRVMVVVIVIGWSGIPMCMAAIANAAMTIIVVASERWRQSIHQTLRDLDWPSNYTV